MPNTPAEARLAIIRRIAILLGELADEQPSEQMTEQFERVADLITEDLGLEVIDLNGDTVTATITPLDGWF